MSGKPGRARGIATLRRVGGGVLAASALAICLAWGLVGLAERLLAIRLLGSIVGLVPAVLRSYGEKPVHLPSWLRRLLLLLIPLLTAACAAIPWILPELYHEHRLPNSAPADVLGVVFGASIAPVAMACVWAKAPPTTYIREAIWCVLSYWLVVQLFMVYTTAIEPLGMWQGPGSTAFYLQEFFRSAALQFEGVVHFGWTALMMVRRFQALQDGSDAAKYAGVLVGLTAAGFQLGMWWLLICDILSPSVHGSGMRRWLLVLFLVAFQIVWAFYTIVLARALLASIRLVQAEMRTVTGAPRAEAAWARRVLLCELVAAVTLGVTSSCARLVYAIRYILPPTAEERVQALNLCVAIAHHLVVLFNALSVAVLSGLLGPIRPRLDGDAGSQCSSPGGRGAEQEFSMSAASPACGPEWAGKVEELAGRGVLVADLLAFWARVNADVGLMPGFDPRRSTTNDIVRRAVIPLSRHPSNSGGSALASIWSRGDARVAECMVTHNWSNLFLHLVAAVVADCLGEECYSGVAAELLTAEGTAAVRKRLEASCRPSTTYWICAFSINQHAGICGGFGRPPPEDAQQYADWDSKRRDTVTGEVFAPCPCTQAKVFNDQPALCEMNKFSLMMRWLSRRSADFSHLVVVDAQFEVFQRAWCVAEIVESGTSGIPQRIMIHSQEVLDRHYQSLSTLDVRECQASRPEDRDMILAAISDIDRFNSQLQWAIFGTEGLFQNWVDGQERSVLIARILRRARSSNSASSAAAAEPLAARRAVTAPSGWPLWWWGGARAACGKATRKGAEEEEDSETSSGEDDGSEEA